MKGKEEDVKTMAMSTVLFQTNRSLSGWKVFKQSHQTQKRKEETGFVAKT